jgi:hypothetical protein
MISGVIYGYPSERGWRSSWISTRLLPARYVSLIDVGGQPLVVYMGTLGTKGVSQEGIYAARSSDGGKTWGAPTLLYPLSATDDAWIPRLWRTTNGDVHLVWGRRTVAGAATSDSIGHMVLVAQTGTWQRLPDLAVAGGTDVIEVTARGDTLLLLTRQTSTGRVRVSTLTDGHWSTDSVSIQRPAASVPMFVRGNDGELYIALGVVSSAAPTTAHTGIPILVLSRYQSTCARFR